MTATSLKSSTGTVTHVPLLNLKAQYASIRDDIEAAIREVCEDQWFVMGPKVVELEEKGADNPALAESLPGFVRFFTDLCHVQAARAAGEVGRICTELVFGYNRHPSWEGGENCFTESQLIQLESIMPGLPLWSVDIVRTPAEIATQPVREVRESTPECR